MFINETVSNFPNITEIIFKSINKKYFNVILLNVMLSFLTILIGFITINYLNLFEETTIYFYLFYIGFVVFLITIVFIKFFGFRQRKYAVREKDISYKSGIFFKKLTTVPFSRVQHIELDEGPLSRFFKLVALSVYTAGDSRDDLEIKGISKKEALEIKEFISQKINE
jgi:membrane protein YdbS with pleckstrin-like domain